MLAAEQLLADVPVVLCNRAEGDRQDVSMAHRLLDDPLMRHQVVASDVGNGRLGITDDGREVAVLDGAHPDVRPTHAPALNGRAIRAKGLGASDAVDVGTHACLSSLTRSPSSGGEGATYCPLDLLARRAGRPAYRVGPVLTHDVRSAQLPGSSNTGPFDLPA